MVAHNNPIQSVHLRKKWQFHVKTWFDQPAKKAARRAHRALKAKKAHPRPANALRPVVRCQTVKYNSKAREGRGFSLAELRAAGISPKAAAGYGITVDIRRRNRSEEGFNVNVERLKAYKARIVEIGRKTKVNADDLAAAVTTTPPAVWNQEVEAPRALTDAEKKAQQRPHVANMLRQSLMNQKLYGRRVKKQERRAENKANADRRAAKKASKE